MEKVFRWQALIDSGKFSNVHELARVIGKDDGYVSLIIRLAAGEILPLFFILYSKVGFPFKAKIRTILENNPAGLLWCGGYIYFGRKVLNDFVYYQ